MKKSNFKYSNFFLFLLILSPIYQDSILGSFIGAAGYSFIMPSSLIVLTLYILINKKIQKNKFLSELINLGFFMICISFIAILIWVFAGNAATIVGEFLPIKAIKVILQYISYPSYIYLIIICIRKCSIYDFGLYCFITLIILFLICLLEMQQIPYAFRNIHYSGVFPYWRIRLLTLESSSTAMQIYVYSAISIHWAILNKKRIFGIITFICIMVLFYFTDSKTLMGSVAITGLMNIMISLKKLKKRAIINLIVAMLIIFVFYEMIWPVLLKSINNDIMEYTSVATRIYTMIIGLLIGVVFPFGVGCGVYLGVFQNTLLKYLPLFSEVFIGFNTSEIVDLATRTNDTTLTVKSGILHFNMYWGIIGTIYLMKNFFKLSKEISKIKSIYSNMLISFFWTTVILLIIAMNFSFEFWLLYAFLLCLIEKNKLEGEKNGKKIY